MDGVWMLLEVSKKDPDPHKSELHHLSKTDACMWLLTVSGSAGGQQRHWGPGASHPWLCPQAASRDSRPEEEEERPHSPVPLLGSPFWEHNGKDRWNHQNGFGLIS